MLLKAARIVYRNAVWLKAVRIACRNAVWLKAVRIVCKGTTRNLALFAGHPKPA